MKKSKIILLSMVISIISSVCVYAQSVSEGSNDKVSLNIVLYPIQTIVVNSNQKVLDLEYLSEEDYQSGVSTNQADHLTIYSTGAFNVNVESVDDKMMGKDKNIAVSDIKITASKGSNNNLPSVEYAANVLLSAAAASLVRSKTGGVDQTFDVMYEAAGDDKYINHYDVDDSPTVFTTTVTYSILAE